MVTIAENASLPPVPSMTELPYTLTQPERGKQFVSDHLAHQHDWAWSLLLAPTRIAQTTEILKAITNDIDGQFARFKGEVTKAEKMFANLQIVDTELEEVRVNYEAWAVSAGKFKEWVGLRVKQTKEARRLINIAEAAQRDADTDRWARDMLANLVEQVALHQRKTDNDEDGWEPNENDLRLWRFIWGTRLPEDSGALIDLIKRRVDLTTLNDPREKK